MKLICRDDEIFVNADAIVQVWRRFADITFVFTDGSQYQTVCENKEEARRVMGEIKQFLSKENGQQNVLTLP